MSAQILYYLTLLMILNVFGLCEKTLRYSSYGAQIESSADVFSNSLVTFYPCSKIICLFLCLKLPNCTKIHYHQKLCSLLAQSYDNGLTNLNSSFTKGIVVYVLKSEPYFHCFNNNLQVINFNSAYDPCDLRYKSSAKYISNKFCLGEFYISDEIPLLIGNDTYYKSPFTDFEDIYKFSQVSKFHQNKLTCDQKGLKPFISMPVFCDHHSDFTSNTRYWTGYKLVNYTDSLPELFMETVYNSDYNDPYTLVKIDNRDYFNFDFNDKYEAGYKCVYFKMKESFMKLRLENCEQNAQKGIDALCEKL